jgi:flagellar motor switch protein FliM
MKVERYDFRKPGRLVSDIEEQLTRWFSAMCTRVPERWAKHIAFQPGLQLKSIESVQLDAALGQSEESLVGHRASFNGADANSLILFTRPLALLLVAGMVGDGGKCLPEDRELSVVEESMLEHFIETYLVGGLQESWPGVAPPLLRLGAKELEPQYTRMMPADTVVVVCAFTISGPFGEATWRWIVHQKALLGFLAQALDTRGSRSTAAETRERMEKVVKELPVPISVTLGTAQLPLGALSALRAGDLVILDQRVSEPLPACVAGEKKFRVWPGRLGQQQAIQIYSSYEP